MHKSLRTKFNFPLSPSFINSYTLQLFKEEKISQTNCENFNEIERQREWMKYDKKLGLCQIIPNQLSTINLIGLLTII